MPRTRPAPGQRPGAPQTAKARLDAVIDRAFDIEPPLAAARELVEAVQMIGDGMAADNNDQGPPIAAVARTVLDWPFAESKQKLNENQPWAKVTCPKFFSNLA